MHPWFYLVRKREERHPSGEERRWSGSENTQGILRRRLSLSLSRSLSSSRIYEATAVSCAEGPRGQGEAAPPGCRSRDGLREVQRDKRLRAGQPHCKVAALVVHRDGKQLSINVCVAGLKLIFQVSVLYMSIYFDYLHFVHKLSISYIGKTRSLLVFKRYKFC